MTEAIFHPFHAALRNRFSTEVISGLFFFFWLFTEYNRQSYGFENENTKSEEGQQKNKTATS